jgi:hypothetical protein
LLHHRPKSRSSTILDLDCPLIHQQKIRLREPTACGAYQRLLLPLGNWMVRFDISDYPIFLS